MKTPTRADVIGNETPPGMLPDVTINGSTSSGISGSMCGGCAIVGLVLQTLVAIKDFGYHQTTKPTPHGFNKVQSNTNKVNTSQNYLVNGKGDSDNRKGISDKTLEAAGAFSDGESITLKASSMVMKSMPEMAEATELLGKFARKNTAVGIVINAGLAFRHIYNKNATWKDGVNLVVAAGGVVLLVSGIGETYEAAELIYNGASFVWDVVQIATENGN